MGSSHSLHSLPFTLSNTITAIIKTLTYKPSIENDDHSLSERLAQGTICSFSRLFILLNNSYSFYYENIIKSGQRSFVSLVCSLRLVFLIGCICIKFLFEELRLHSLGIEIRILNALCSRYFLIELEMPYQKNTNELMFVSYYFSRNFPIIVLCIHLLEAALKFKASFS